ncbi:flagellar assembly peptidoglycan hydrolase FlgJ [Dechloromonas sp. ZY10]|uniref:flagellar assembly peptidoglycan hydrolase FlgJ n=1 Tax=Dechloromonas aquae TaxID=2664436 RepID=UPI0035292375
MVGKIQQQPNRAAFDVQGAQDLRRQLRDNSPESLKAAAQQFESMFLQMVLKSMRDTVPQDGLLDSDQTRFYNGLLDQQMAQNLASSGRGIGFARLIEQQLGRHLGGEGSETAKAADLLNGLPPNMIAPLDAVQHRQTPANFPSSASYAAVSRIGNEPVGRAGDGDSAAKDFVARVWPHALEASRSTGIPPQFLVAHAALESGWGKSEPRQANGSNSHNLFGIKAGVSWTGGVAEAGTTEFVNGQAQQSVERFRAYSSYAEAFRDYAALLRNNPRYSGVIGAQDGTEFARRLQQAGYATDPMYADKLSRIISGPTLRQALIG